MLWSSFSFLSHMFYLYVLNNHTCCPFQIFVHSLAPVPLQHYSLSFSYVSHNGAHSNLKMNILNWMICCLFELHWCGKGNKRDTNVGSEESSSEQSTF